MCLKLGTLVILFLGVAYGDFPHHFMTHSCNKNIGTRVAGRLETSFALTYDQEMDCWTTMSVESGKRIFMFFKRFEVEEELDGACVDAMTVYEGPDTSSSILVPETCGYIQDPFNYTTTGNQATFHFFSDSNSVFRGFEVIYVAYTPPPCGSNEYACSNGVLCIDSSLECDDIDQCGDGSDEAHCAALKAEQEANELPLGLIIGCSVGGLVLLIIIIIVICKVYQYYYWKHWLARNQSNASVWEYGDEDLYSYPKTDKYQVYEIGKKGRRKPQVSEYFTEEKTYYEQTVQADELSRYLDEK